MSTEPKIPEKEDPREPRGPISGPIQGAVPESILGP